MESHQFDAATRRLAQHHQSRRGLLWSGGLTLGAFAAGLFPLRRGVAAPAARQATPAVSTTASPDAIAIDDAWFCNQTFALCNTAVCERSVDDPKTANCHCVVLNGYSIGFKSCEERVQNGNSLWSTFSTANVNSEFGILECPEDAAWVNCLDYPCELNPRDPALATCQCAVVETGPFRTFGGRCEASVCHTELLSGTSLEVPGVQQYLDGMQQVQQPVTLPKVCPAATPTAG